MKTEAPLLPGFKLDQTFFGFKPKHQVELHDKLFDLLWAGDGRWDWDTIYNLPLPIRKFWIMKINKMRTEEMERQAEALEKAKNRSKQPKTP